MKEYEINPNTLTAGGNVELKFDLQKFAVCKIEDNEYESLADAVAAAKDGDTIKLIDDITEVGGTVFVTKQITLDLDGKTISGSIENYLLDVSSTGDLTVTGEGKIENIVKYGSVINVDGGKLKVESGNISADTFGIRNAEGEVTISGGTLTSGCSAIYNIDGELTINGGTFTSGNSAIDNIDGGEVTINSGTFTGGNYAISNIEDGKVTVNGGTFNKDISKYLGKGATITENDGTWTIIPPVCRIGETGYEKFEDAIAAVKDGETITMIRDGELSDIVTVNKQITLDLNGRTISGNIRARQLISVKGDLTITGEGAIKNVAENGSVINVERGGNLKVESGEFYGSFSAVRNFGGTIAISGGNFTSDHAAINNYVGTLAISGGKFNQDVSEWIVEGLSITENGSTWTVNPPLALFENKGENVNANLEIFMTFTRKMGGFINNLRAGDNSISGGYGIAGYAAGSVYGKDEVKFAGETNAAAADVRAYDLFCDSNFMTDNSSLSDITEQKVSVTGIQTANTELAQETPLITFTEK